MVWTGPTTRLTPQSAIDNRGCDMTARESSAESDWWESLKSPARVMVLSRSPSYQMLNPAGAAMIPPPLAVRPELTEDDVAWLNAQMALTDRPPVRYARELPIPPLPSGIRPRRS